MRGVEVAILLAAAGGPACGAPAEPGRWFARVGVLDARYHSGADIAANGEVLPGATAHVSNNVTLTFDVGYEITNDLAVMLMVGIPPKPTITGEQTVSALGELGKVRYGPAILTTHYRFPKLGPLRPYAGLGVAYAIILKEHDASVSHLEVHNNWGLVLQAGAEYGLGSRRELFVDFKQLWLAVDAHGLLAGGVPVTANVRLDPTLISAGIRFHFN
jgi:outer membrane protein